MNICRPGLSYRRRGRGVGTVGGGGRSARVLAVAALVALVFTCAPASAAPASVKALMNAGIAAYRAGAPIQALRAFSEAVVKAPMDALPALWAGTAAMAAKGWEEARAYFREALRRPHTIEEGRLAEAWLLRLDALSTPVPTSVDRSFDAQEGIAKLALWSNPRLTVGQARWIGIAVETAARQQGIDPWLLAAVIYIESRFNHESVSWAGAVGLGQLMPGTAQAVGVDPKDPWQNVLGAAHLLRWHYLEFKDWTLALAAYNAGAQAVRRYGGVPPYAETQWYVRAVLWVYGQLRRPS